jgi:hypothetical protein
VSRVRQLIYLGCVLTSSVVFASDNGGDIQSSILKTDAQERILLQEVLVR